LGLILNARGSLRAAQVELQRSVAVLVDAGAAAERIALARVNLAVVELHLGRIVVASALFKASLEVFESHRLTSEIITALNGLAHCERARGRFEAAETLHRRALHLVEPDHARQLGLCHEFLGRVAFDRGQWKRAEEHYARALEVAAAIAPDGDLMLEICWHQAELLIELGRLAAADEYLSRAEALCARSDERRELGSVQRVRATWMERSGDPRAREAFAVALETLESTGKAFEAALCRLAAARGEARRGEAIAGESLARCAAAFAAIDPDSAWLARVACEHDQVHASGESMVPRWGFVTRDPEMTALLDALPEIAATSYSVLLEGESGTGKEVLARALHQASGRHGAFVAVNCAAIPRDLFESELFGHVRGAYSGAAGEKIGLIEHADGGTLLLDEIGDMPAEMQAKLLRFLDDNCVRRVGDVRERRVQVKIVAATNRGLQDAVQSGAFRRDLYHRLAAHPLRIKPLRERRGDIAPLAAYLLAQEGLRARLELDGELLADLEARPWAGNVRELRNHLVGLALRATVPATSAGGPALRASLRTSRSSHERRTIEAALATHGGRVPEAARQLGLHVTTLRRKMRALGIERSASPVA
jgi:two-component system NtrC family response regulator